MASFTHPANSATFPVPLNPVSENQDAPSFVSSRMTDLASDDGQRAEDVGGDDDRAGAASPANTFYDDGPDASTASPGPASPTWRPTTRSSYQGEQSRPPSRPSTAATGTASQRGAWASQRLRPHPSSAASARRGSGVTAGRPTSSASRTHVPSITSHAFFRPMSSQRLQAQRAGRSSTATLQTQAGADADAASAANRTSIGSSPAVPEYAVPGGDGYDNEPPPPSRDTELTQPEGPDRATANTSPTGFGGTMRSLTDSVTPLQSRGNTRAGRGLALDPQRTFMAAPTPQRSPRSFRSSFLLPSRGTAQARSSGQPTREELSSAASSPRSATAKPPLTGEKKRKKRLGRNHQYFGGNTVFCLGGRLQNARELPINIMTGLFVLVPGVLFLVFSAPYLATKVSLAIPVAFGYLFLVCMSSFVHASVTDPGILPRNVHPFPAAPAREDPLTLGPPMTGWTTIRSFTNSRTAMEVPTKYCKTCDIWRPPRGHHCRVCDNCIETHDHHCVWLNNCVGRRNYRYFFAFVASGTLLGLYLVGASLTHLLLYRRDEAVAFAAAADRLRIPFAMAIYGVVATPYPAALWAYHSMLIARGETTREYLNSHKFVKKDRHRPFSQGNILKNYTAVLGRPRPPTYLRFKHRYEEGDRRFGMKRSKRRAPPKDEERGTADVGPGPAGDPMEMAPVSQKAMGRLGIAGPGKE
ncbi:MAG: Eukaryotic peptide chain release factor GTP-binding subunit [Thelocarpon impressellum]|nr:MAG: Eukaryotic peptide chain release factor GTP-binding subunit [Thelocarpon impressellum]